MTLETLQIEGEYVYRWKLGDCLASIAIQCCRPSTDWKVLYEHNSSLYYRRHNTIIEGDLIKIPSEWFPIGAASISYDATKIREGNQDYNRESYIKQFYGNIQRYKEGESNVAD